MVVMLTRITNWFILPVTLLLIAATSDRVTAVGSEGARTFLSDLRDRAIERLTDRSIGAAELERRFRTMLRQSFDIQAIGRFVLAVYWRRADQATRRDFLDALETYTVNRFLPLFARYEGQELQFGELRDRGEESSFLAVESRIVRAAGEPIAVEWRIQEREGGYKIVDVITEGVSMAATWRSEYKSVLQANGGDVGDLSDRIRRKAVQLGGTS